MTGTAAYSGRLRRTHALDSWSTAMTTADSRSQGNALGEGRDGIGTPGNGMGGGGRRSEPATHFAGPVDVHDATPAQLRMRGDRAHVGLVVPATRALRLRRAAGHDAGGAFCDLDVAADEQEPQFVLQPAQP